MQMHLYAFDDVCCAHERFTDLVEAFQHSILVHCCRHLFRRLPLQTFHT